MRIYQIGEEIKQNLTFTQKELDLFSTLSKDLNPIHSSEYASTHNLKGSLVQGMLAAARFGEIFGTIFPGTGTINMERNFTFLRPLYTGENYFISVILTDVDLANNIGIMKLSITDANGNIYVLGETKTKNTEVFTVNNYPISEQTSSSASPLAIVQLPSPIDGNLSPLHEIFKKRRSKRYYRKDEIDMQQLANILWSATGVTQCTEHENGKQSYLFTNPTASNHQEVELYVFNAHGIFHYNPIKNQLLQIKSKDYRSAIGAMPFFKKAPLSICLVSNLNKMIHHKEENKRNKYSCMDIGYVSQNIYLYCAANNLSTCACGLINYDTIESILNLKNQRVMLVHPIGVGKDFHSES